MKFLWIVLVFSVILTGCGDNNHTNVTISEMTEVKYSDDIYLHRIRHLYDNRFLLKSFTSPFVNIAELNGDSFEIIQSFCQKGNGEGEMNNLYLTYYNDGNLHLFSDVDSKRYLKYYLVGDIFVLKDHLIQDKSTRMIRFAGKTIRAVYGDSETPYKFRVDETDSMFYKKTDYSESFWINEISNSCYLRSDNSRFYAMFGVTGKLLCYDNELNLIDELELADEMELDYEYGAFIDTNGKYVINMAFDRFCTLGNGILMLYRGLEKETMTDIFYYDINRKKLIAKTQIPYYADFIERAGDKFFFCDGDRAYQFSVAVDGE